MAGNQENTDTRLIGLLAQFDDPDSLLVAGEAARTQGHYTKLDAFTPFPLHGIDQAIGIKRTILPFIVLFIGLNACVGGILLQWYTNAAAWSPLFPGYDFRIGGKPLWSLPANVPVIFEIIVLSSAFAAFFGMLIMNKLPRLANPLQRISRFKRATNDRFFLFIDEKDEKFDLEQTRAQLNEWGSTGIEEVREDMSDQQLPAFVKTVIISLVLLMLIPPVMIYRARGMTSRRPRLHVVPDMDWQYRYEAQEEGPNLGTEKEPVYLFPDVSSNRSQIPGTVEWKDANVNDVEFLTGIAAGSEIPSSLPIPTTKEKREQDEPKKSEPQKSEPGADGTQQEKPVEPEPDWVTSLPKSITVNREFMERGRDRFNIYCVVCHGYSGNGDGLVNRRAMELALIGKSAWTTAKSFHDAEVVKQPVGRIFNTITNGRGTMGPYKDQITAEDRWAIALYVKALQETRKDWVNPESPPASKPAADEKGGDKKSTGQSKKKTAENDKADRGKTEKQPKQNDSGTEKSGNPNDGLAWRKQRN